MLSSTISTYNMNSNYCTIEKMNTHNIKIIYNKLTEELEVDGLQGLKVNNYNKLTEELEVDGLQGLKVNNYNKLTEELEVDGLQGLKVLLVVLKMHCWG